MWPLALICSLGMAGATLGAAAEDYLNPAVYAALCADTLAFYAAKPQLASYTWSVDAASVTMRIDPCHEAANYPLCLVWLREDPARLVHRPLLTVGAITFFSFSLSVYSLQCSDEFMVLDQCGLLFELHRARSLDPLLSLRHPELAHPGVAREVFLDVGALCAGEYELWTLEKQGARRWVIGVTPLYVAGAAC